jgi:hypothetical protein
VTEGDGLTPIPGALVSAQQEDATGSPVVFTSTVTESDGGYALFIKPDPDGTQSPEGDQFNNRYTIVASLKGYEANCVEVITEARMNQPAGTTSLTLSGPKPTGTLAGKVTINNGDPEQYVTLSFRQERDCKADADPPATYKAYVEVQAVNYKNGSSYLEGLTEGFYDVNASTYEEATDLTTDLTLPDVTIAEGAPQQKDITLTLAP